MFSLILSFVNSMSPLIFGHRNLETTSVKTETDKEYDKFAVAITTQELTAGYIKKN